MDEMKFFGLGGQGVVMASQMLGVAYFKAGLYPQCFSVFGGERKGAPVVSFLRVDNEKILLKCEIKRPNIMIYFNESLIDTNEVKSVIKPGGKILINSSRPYSEFSTMDPFKLGLIDARTISEQQGLGRTINTAVLGALCRLSGKPSLEDLLETIEDLAPMMKQANVVAARKGYKLLEIY